MQEPEQPAQRRKLLAKSYQPPDPGPYPQNRPPQNTVCFTPVQVRPALSALAAGPARVGMARC